MSSALTSPGCGGPAQCPACRARVVEHHGVVVDKGAWLYFNQPYQKVQARVRVKGINFCWLSPYRESWPQASWALGAIVLIEYKLGVVSHKKRTKLIVRSSDVGFVGDLLPPLVAKEMGELLKERVLGRLHRFGVEAPEFDWEFRIGRPVLPESKLLACLPTAFAKALAAHKFQQALQEKRFS